MHMHICARWVSNNVRNVLGDEAREILKNAILQSAILQNAILKNARYPSKRLELHPV